MQTLSRSKPPWTEAFMVGNGDTSGEHPVLDDAHAAFWRGVLLKP